MLLLLNKVVNSRPSLGRQTGNLLGRGTDRPSNTETQADAPQHFSGLLVEEGIMALENETELEELGNGFRAPVVVYDETEGTSCNKTIEKAFKLYRSPMK